MSCPAQCPVRKQPQPFQKFPAEVTEHQRPGSWWKWPHWEMQRPRFKSWTNNSSAYAHSPVPWEDVHFSCPSLCSCSCRCGQATSSITVTPKLLNLHCAHTSLGRAGRAVSLNSRFWFSSPGTGPKGWHFWEAPRRCWTMDHTLVRIYVTGRNSQEAHALSSHCHVHKFFRICYASSTMLGNMDTHQN